jgi:ElaB/YqjD/DUF883 family membrane-anchored ribosome-binding protein
MPISIHSKSLRPGASSNSYADDALDATNQALESARQFATQAFEKAGEKVRGVRTRVLDLATDGASSVGDASAAAQKELTRYARVTGRYVAEEPVKAALIAAAVGAAVAALVLAMRRHRTP